MMIFAKHHAILILVFFKNIRAKLFVKEVLDYNKTSKQTRQENKMQACRSLSSLSSIYQKVRDCLFIYHSSIPPLQVLVD